MFFSRSRLDLEVTASDVKKSYASRIENFFREVEGPDLNIFRRRENSLDGLFAWGYKVLAVKSELESQLSYQTKACKKAEIERDALRKSFQDVESKLQKISAKNQKMEDKHSLEIRDIMVEHSKTLAESQRKYDLDMAKADREHENTKIQYEKHVASLTQQHQSTVESLNENHQNFVDTLTRDYESELEKLKKDHEITAKRLRGQLLSNQSEYKGWPDEKLRLKFKDLKELVDLITAPQRQELSIPKSERLESKLDPSGFINRAGNENAHFLLRSLVWSIFYEHFFSLPFGFGVFGPTSSKNPLLQVFNSWYKVIEGHDTQGKVYLPKRKFFP